VLSFANAILLLGAAQGFVLGGILMVKRGGNTQANRILGCILVLLSVSILLHAVSHASGFLPGDSHMIVVELITILSAPLIYLYTKTLTSFQFKLSSRQFIHLVPFAAALVAAGVALSARAPGWPGLMRVTLVVMTTVTMLGYIVAANVVLFRHAVVVKNNFSSLRKVSLRWLRIFVAVLTVFWVFAGLFDLVFKEGSMDAVWIASCAIIYLIGYFGFVQPQVFSDPFAGSGPKTESGVQKYEKSSLTPDMAEVQLRKLTTAMEKERLYTNKDLSLSRLALELKIPLHHLSQIINETIGSNFYDFINSQRINEAKRLLIDPALSNRSIASIGFDVGFNSLSAFNAAFRKFVRTTPSEFRKSRSV
jgi:AraC-like DNA-binding protein